MSADPSPVFTRRLSKRFPGVLALDAVDFELKAGEVHALVGENGAGKSTLIKMITGAETPDEGELWILGAEQIAGPNTVRRGAGVTAIYQELTIIPEITAVDNMFLGQVPHRGFLVRRQAMRDRFRDIARRLGVAIDPETRAGSLSIADQQMVEIMRALVAEHRVLIMDEPTASLGPAERAKLFDVIGDLRRGGGSIIYISHDLGEVLRLADRISVMRGGALIATAPVDRWTQASLVAAMVGDLRPPPARRDRAGTPRPALLGVTSLSVPGRVADISFALREGEILGIAGLVGAGRTEILRAIAGAEPGATGRITLDGRERPLFRSARAAVRAGISLVPEDRKLQGIVPLLPGDANVVLTDLGSVSRWGFVQRRARRERAERVTGPLGFRPERLKPPIGTLSGGNQQKLVIGKCLHGEPRILLLDEPTRGIDIGAKAEIFASIRALAQRGMGVILVSSELEEVVAHADRVLVLAQGRLAAEYEAASASVEAILRRIFAVEKAA